MTNGFMRQTTTPLNVPRTKRNHVLRTLTSFPAGRVAPVAVIPFLREDGGTCRMQVSTEMMETAEILMNPVKMKVSAYFFPLLAAERFGGSMDIFNRSYAGLEYADVEGAGTIDFFETAAAPAAGSDAIYNCLGLHAKPGELINTFYKEAYNLIDRFRAQNCSPDLPLRTRLQSDLAPAFWGHTQFQHVKPDFDQAVIDGEVALKIANGKLNVKGIGFTGTEMARATALASHETGGGAAVAYPHGYTLSSASSADAAGRAKLAVKTSGDTFVPDVYVEVSASNGLSVSLADLEAAKKTQAFAKLRAKYSEHSEQFVVDMLMDGLSIPDQMLKQPVLLLEREAVFGQAKRYASDAGNLMESATNGGASVTLEFSVPRTPCGGVVMILVECVPEQLFERQKDPFFQTTQVASLPAYMRDELDPEKVVVVRNDEVDVSHGTPAGVFGYGPLNWMWNVLTSRVGGKFLRPTVDAAFDEDRQRIWAVETANPALAEDFYRSKTMHIKPFLVTNVHPFECTILGNCVISGNTVFGGELAEATNDYDTIAAKVPSARIAKPEEG